jgi:hypothetical protein
MSDGVVTPADLNSFSNLGDLFSFNDKINQIYGMFVGLIIFHGFVTCRHVALNMDLELNGIWNHSCYCRMRVCIPIQERHQEMAMCCHYPGVHCYRTPYSRDSWLGNR